MRLMLPFSRLAQGFYVKRALFPLSVLMLLGSAFAAAPYPLWTKDVKALGSLAVSENGDLSFIGLDAKLHHLDSAGKEKWNFALGDVGRAEPLLTPQGNTIVAAYDNTVQAIDPNGKKLWATRLDGNIFAAPALRPDGSLIVASSVGSVYALSAGGQVLWQRQVGAPIFSSPVVGTDGHIYFGTQGNTFMALDSHGAPLWSFATGATVFSSPALDSQGNLYFGSGDKKIYSLAPTGALRWSYVTEGFVNASPIVTSGGLVVVGSYDNKVYALTTDGQKVWEYAATGSIAAPAAELVGGTILVGDLNGTLHALNTDGQAQWTYKAGEKIDTSVNASPQGQVYLAAGAGKVTALNVAPLASGPWSFYRQLAAGYGRPLSPEEQARVAALKQAASQKVLAAMPKASTSKLRPQPTIVVIPPAPTNLATLAQVQGGQIWLPAAPTLVRLGATAVTWLPNYAAFNIGVTQYTVPITSRDNQVYLTLKDLGQLRGAQASYTKGKYQLRIPNSTGFDLEINFGTLLPLEASKEFPDVISY